MKFQKVFVGIVIGLIGLAFAGIPLLQLISSIGGSSTKPATAPVADKGGDSTLLSRQADGFALVLKREPNNFNALTGLADIRLKQGNIPAAIALYKQLRANTTDPQASISATLEIARLYQQTGQIPEALAEFDGLLKINPKFAPALLGKAVTLKMSGQTQAAQAQYLQALAAASAELKPQITEIFSKVQTPVTLPTNPPAKVDPTKK